MRLPHLAAALLALAACGDDGGGTTDGRPRDGAMNDGPAPIDGAEPDADNSCTPVKGTAVALEPVVTSGLTWPVYVTAAPGDNSRLFVLEKRGNVRVIENGTLLDDPFLTVDVPTINSQEDERGLLGLAFHPDYQTNRRFYVFYTDTSSDTVIEQYLRSENSANLADEASVTPVFFADDEAGNHNGGTLQFGHDGYLYAALGDGGGANDPDNNAQNLQSPFGKILRFDVNGAKPAIPASNPFAAAGDNALDEIWSYGWRNPWRFSFDRETGDMYVGDVGQDAWEEVDVEPASSTGGLNYGWKVMEGNHCRPPTSGCDTANKVAPVYEYAHAGSVCTVVGGYVYRGCRMPDLHGTYFFADYCADFMRTFRWDGAGGVTGLDELDLQISNTVSFGEDNAGEMYVVMQGPGDIYKIVPAN